MLFLECDGKCVKPCFGVFRKKRFDKLFDTTFQQKDLSMYRRTEERQRKGRGKIGKDRGRPADCQVGRWTGKEEKRGEERREERKRKSLYTGKRGE